MSLKRTNSTLVRPALPLPHTRQDVVLTLPGDERYGARVNRVSEHEVVLVLLLDSRGPLTPGELVPMALEFAGAHGLVRLEGDGTVATHDLVRFRIDGAEVVQRRDYVRVRVVRPLALAPLRADGRPGAYVDTLTVNVSGNGVLAAGPGTLQAGTDVRLRLRLTEGEPPIEGTGRVARVTEEGRRGIAIDALDDDGQRRLVRFIFEQERIARQRTRDRES